MYIVYILQTQYLSSDTKTTTLKNQTLQVQNSLILIFLNKFGTAILIRIFLIFRFIIINSYFCIFLLCTQLHYTCTDYMVTTWL